MASTDSSTRFCSLLTGSINTTIIIIIIIIIIINLINSNIADMASSSRDPFIGHFT